MEFTPVTLALLGLLLAAWTVGAGWLMLAAGRQMRAARSARGAVRRLTKMMSCTL